MPANWVGDPPARGEWWIWENIAGIQTSLNAGALFGMGHGYSGLFALLSIVAAIGIVVWLFRFGAAHELFLTVALACVMAGICGNLYDRLGLWHAPGTPDVWPNLVRDWILFRYRGYSWPNFNVADSLLVCGAGLLLWHGFFLADQQPPAASADPQAPNDGAHD